MPNEMTTAEKLRHWALWCDCTNNGCEIKWLLLEAAAEIEKKEWHANEEIDNTAK